MPIHSNIGWSYWSVVLVGRIGRSYWSVVLVGRRLYSGSMRRVVVALALLVGDLVGDQSLEESLEVTI
jgi:hypothetical protein